MIVIKHSGNFNKTDKFLKLATKLNYTNILDKYGKQGVDALSSVTPIDSGETSKSWSYKIKNTSKSVSIYWTNSHVEDGVPIAILLQYGHGTRNGGYVQGRDYINPIIRPIFDRISDELWREVTSL